jgi:TPP-dependent indolepyruvate ferredoxin oxidoreductase alpha subunit
VDVFHRRELDRLQKELRETAGTTVLIHDQTCAAENAAAANAGIPRPGQARLHQRKSVRRLW